MFYKQDKNDIVLFVKVVPNAAATKIGDEYNNMLKIFIDTVAQDNKANKKLIKFLSKKFHIPKTDIIIEKGNKSREKVLRIINGASKWGRSITL